MHCQLFFIYKLSVTFYFFLLIIIFFYSFSAFHYYSFRLYSFCLTVATLGNIFGDRKEEKKIG